MSSCADTALLKKSFSKGVEAAERNPSGVPTEILEGDNDYIRMKMICTLTGEMDYFEKWCDAFFKGWAYQQMKKVG